MYANVTINENVNLYFKVGSVSRGAVGGVQSRNAGTLSGNNCNSQRSLSAKQNPNPRIPRIFRSEPLSPCLLNMNFCLPLISAAFNFSSYRPKISPLQIVNHFITKFSNPPPFYFAPQQFEGFKIRPRDKKGRRNLKGIGKNHLFHNLSLIAKLFSHNS